LTRQTLTHCKPKDNIEETIKNTI